MFKKSTVSLKGRWIIFSIFIVCGILPELLALSMAAKSAYPKYVIGMSVVRILWGLPLYYFMMLGHSWARYLMIVLLLLSAAMLFGSIEADTLFILGVPLVVVVAAVTVLIFSNHVRPRGFR